jgi:hypothetical protein
LWLAQAEAIDGVKQCGNDEEAAAIYLIERRENCMRAEPSTSAWAKGEVLCLGIGHMPLPFAPPSYPGEEAVQIALAQNASKELFEREEAARLARKRAERDSVDIFSQAEYNKSALLAVFRSRPHLKEVGAPAWRALTGHSNHRPLPCPALRRYMRGLRCGGRCTTWRTGSLSAGGGMATAATRTLQASPSE